VALKGAVDLRALARMVDCRYEELKLLNPAVLHHAANGRNGVTMIRVPRGTGEALMAKLESGARLPSVDLTVQHKVRRGETLISIASDYHVSARALALANGIGRKRPLRRGMTLAVPASIGSPAIAQLEDGDPRASTSYVPSRNISPPRQVQGKSEAEGRSLHTVRRGETLAGIAGQYGVSVQDLRTWNRLKTDSVRRGTRLKLRTGEAGVAAPAPASDRTADAASGAPASSTEGPIAATASTRHTVTPLAAPITPASDAAAAPSVAPATRSSGGRSVAAKAHAGTRGRSAATHVIVVRPGSTLSEMAQQHGVSVRELMKLNGLRSSRVRAGQKLRVPTS